jgi:HK97 family phage prohead protease
MIIFFALLLVMLIKGINQPFADSDVKSGIITGYFAVFGSKDSDGDIIEKGAFSKTIQERHSKGLIKYLLDHDKTKVVAKIKTLEEDSFGLKYEAQIGSHALGQDFQKMVESELINQHSFGYQVVKEQYDSKSRANYLKEVKLFEGSAIQFLGSNSETTIIDLKSATDVMEYLAKLDKFIRTSDATDETLVLLEEKLKSLLLTIKPSDDTLEKKLADEQKIKSIIENAFNNL